MNQVGLYSASERARLRAVEETLWHTTKAYASKKKRFFKPDRDRASERIRE